MREIENWLDLHDSTENEDVQMAAREYMDLLRDNVIDLKTSFHERQKIIKLLNETTKKT